MRAISAIALAVVVATLFACAPEESDSDQSSGESPTSAVTVEVTEETPSPTAVVQPPRPAATPTVYYRNCTEARAAGAAPIKKGEPGYGTHLDRDRDGIACDQ